MADPSPLEDVRDGVATWKITLDTWHALTLAFVLAFFLSPINPRIAQALVPAVIFCVAWGVKRGIEDLRAEMQTRSRHQPRIAGRPFSVCPLLSCCSFRPGYWGFSSESVDGLVEKNVMPQH